MSAFYDQKDLEEELSRVEDLDFEYLFEYEQPCSDVAGASRGLSDAFLSLCGDSPSFCPTQGSTGVTTVTENFNLISGPQTGSDFPRARCEQ